MSDPPRGATIGGRRIVSRAIELAPKKYASFLVRGALYKNAGDKEHAREDFEQVIRLAPPDDPAAKAARSALDEMRP